VSGLYGDVSGLHGDVSGLYGNVSGIRGSIDECQLTTEERLRGVAITELMEDNP